MGLVNAFGALGLDSTLQAIRDRLGTLLTSTPSNTTAGSPVRVIGETIDQCTFADVGSGLLTTDMTQRYIGTGVGVSQASGNLLITTGTGTNAEYLARSVKSWQGQWNLKIKNTHSQRIVQNNFVVLMADSIGEGLAYTINSATSITVTKVAHGFTSANVGQSMMIGGLSVAGSIPGRYAIASIPSVDTINFTVAGYPASGTGTLDLFGWNHTKVVYNTATATNAFYDTMRKGWTATDTTLTINTSVTGHVLQLQNDIRSNFVSDFVTTSSAALTSTARGSRVENLPDDGTELYLYLWSYNGTSAPASTTTWTVGFWSVERFVKNPVHIAGTMLGGLQTPLAVALPGTQAVSATNLSCNIAQMNGVATTMGNGVVGTGVQRVAVASDNTPFSINTAPATVLANACAVGTATALTVLNIKASAGNVYGFSVVNKTASALYLQFYNTASAPTLGTSVIFWIPIAASQTLHVPPGTFAIANFATGIGIGASTTPTSTGTPGTAPEVVIYYK
jgi:hypothetical protein